MKSKCVFIGQKGLMFGEVDKIMKGNKVDIILNKNKTFFDHLMFWKKDDQRLLVGNLNNRTAMNFHRVNLINSNTGIPTNQTVDVHFFDVNPFRKLEVAKNNEAFLRLEELERQNENLKLMMGNLVKRLEDAKLPQNLLRYAKEIKDYSDKMNFYNPAKN